MTRRKLVPALFVPLLLLASTAGARPPVPQVSDEELRAISGVIGTDEIRVLAAQRITLPDRDFTRYKVLDSNSGRLRRLALEQGDDGRLQVVPARTLIRDARERELRANGWLPAPLLQTVQGIEARGEPDVEMLPVALKMRVPIPPQMPQRPEPPARLTTAALERMLPSARRAWAQIELNAEQQFLQLVAPFKPDRYIVSGAFITARLPVSVIRRIALDRDQGDASRLLYIQLEPQLEIPLATLPINDALPQSMTNLVHVDGNTGANVKIGVLEDRPVYNQEHLGLTEIQDPDLTADATETEPWHLTKVLALIRNNMTECGDWEGYATGAEVYVANDRSETEDNFKKRYEWACAQGANIISMSWKLDGEQEYGTMSPRDVYFDWVSTLPPYPTVLTATGNSPSMYALGRGYNILSVGDVYLNELADACLSERSSKNSSQVYESYIDRRLPEITTPGSRHEAILSNFGKSSAATPVAASIAALIMSENETLKACPVAVRAILMATAIDRPVAEDESTSIDDVHAGGLLNASAAVACAGTSADISTTAYPTAHVFGSIGTDSFSSGTFEPKWLISAGAGTHVRVALTWTSTALEESTTLDADLDLIVLDETGLEVASSLSYNNSFEIVEFTSTNTAEYTITIHDDKDEDGWWDYDTKFAVAWTTNDSPCSEYGETLFAAIDLEKLTREDPDGPKLADLLGWHWRELEILDWRLFPVAFLEGRYEEYTVRRLTNGLAQTIVLDEAGDRVDDPDDLREQDRTRAKRVARRFDPLLLDRILREPDGPPINVRIRLDLDALGRPGRDRHPLGDQTRLRRARRALAREFARRKIDVPFELDRRRPRLDIRLSRPQLVSLADCTLIKSIETAW